MNEKKDAAQPHFVLTRGRMRKASTSVCISVCAFFIMLQSEAAVAASPEIKAVTPASTAGNVAAKTTTIAIDNFAFTPATLEIATGSTVTWVNHDDMPHTVVSDAKPHIFASPPLDTDDHYAYLFSKPGTYTYFCSMHPRMIGTIIVK